MRFILILLLTAFSNISIYAQSVLKPSFKLIPLGVYGGSDESNLSAYMLAPVGSNNYICLDAGTLRSGLKKVSENHVVNAPAEVILKDSIKAYLISHPHLDHLTGLVINSPDDASKIIYALPYTIEVFKTHYFSWKSWANFADQGETPTLKKYHYKPLGVDSTTAIENTEMNVRAFRLSHTSTSQSTAFLVNNKDSYFLYLGDTGADRIEKSGKLDTLWKAVAPFLRAGKLKGISIEVSYPNEQPEKNLFGHLTPALLMEELNKLADLAGRQRMKNLKVVIAHIKPNGDNEAKIHEQLKQLNKFGVDLIFPEQGKEIWF
ncbi:3',5'-cyclic-nucleotide phosphodiesterase [Pedobacter sp. HMF7647]|uniref:3',5'-cyclic-nucleotide phosphodiesterase n=1 Tax=Hufsiella arboris TaxID=2695275 RepID=A0A7K1YEM9_9SPHI|nr:3',5'-cyclic-nucleotide phosphodiesterase [Hufsiella arboris]MXV53055.1 3',5'-cyclic-nucleotide phosphodiesterase [Hufsiella arboris]